MPGTVPRASHTVAALIARGGKHADDIHTETIAPDRDFVDGPDREILQYEAARDALTCHPLILRYTVKDYI